MTDQALADFKKLWKDEFGEDLTDAIALEEATAIVTLFSTIYRPIKKEWLDDIDN
jgi:hypothetical protein